MRTATNGPFAGQWRFAGILVLYVCPKCNKQFGLNHHSIREDGVVTPSVVCPRGWLDDEGKWKVCDFHDELKLENWP